MTVRSACVSLSVACAAGFALASSWSDVSEAIRLREAGWVPTGAAVSGGVWAGSVLAEATVESGAEYVTATRPFDSVSFNLGFSDCDRFYSVTKPGFLLFLR